MAHTDTRTWFLYGMLIACLTVFFITCPTWEAKSQTEPTESELTLELLNKARGGMDASTKFKNIPVSKWRTGRSFSEMDDSVIFTIQKDAIAPVDAWPNPVLPILVAQCRENKTNVFLIIHTSFTPILGEFEKAKLRIRIDDKNAFTQLWDESTDNEAAFSPEPINFLKMIRSAQRIRVEFTPINAKPVTAEFDLEGLPYILDELAQTCKWKL